MAETNEERHFEACALLMLLKLVYFFTLLFILFIYLFY